MKRVILAGIVSGLFVLGSVGIAQANIIRNASFENVSSSSSGQGFLPDDWVNITPPSPAADTYSDDGSYGLSPGDWGHFAGVTAKDGHRWVAGWSAGGQESFGQWLTAPLIAGTNYDVSAWLHQDTHTSLNNPGGYEIFLTDTPGIQTEMIGVLGSTTSGGGWEQFSFSFTATTAMAELDFIEFGPSDIGSGGVYPGLDLVSMTATSSVPEPSTVALLGIGLAGLAGAEVRRRRKKKADKS